MVSKDINQIKKGILKILVLKLLQEEKRYGYELLVEMDKRSGGFFKIKEGTLYPILYKLEDDGFVISEWEFPGNREKARKYYFITEEGRRELCDLAEFWNDFVVNVQEILNG